MELLNAGDWRVERDQIVTEITTRLLRWMSSARGGEPLETDEVALRLHDALNDLTGAQASAILVRGLAGETLALLAATGVADEKLAAREERFSPTALFAEMPRAPFFPHQAGAPEQVLLAELNDWTRVQCVACGGTSGFEAAGLSSQGGTVGTFQSAGAEVEMPSLVVPLASDDQEITGVALLWIATPDGLINGELQAPLHAAARQAGGWLLDAMRLERVGASYRNLGAVFANAIDAKDVLRQSHSTTVAYYCTLIAQGLGLPEHEIERLEFAGLLHGLGKIAVPDALLFKQAALSPDERETVRAATVGAAEWLRDVDGLAEIADIVRHQGERFDGTGYPDGLSGEEIPLGARVLAVALRFASMTQARADRRAMSVVGGAFEALAADSGKSLDPEIVAAFLAEMGRTF